MVSDHDERKHRRLSDDESREPSKRRKHRHHRRHHHRHHSRKHEDILNEEEEGTSEMPPPPPPPAAGAVSYKNCPPDYDMEEGEIVEEEGADVEEKKRVDSDAESGEIKTETHGVATVLDHSLKLPSDDHNAEIVGELLNNENSGSMTKPFVERNPIDGTKKLEVIDLQTSLIEENNDSGDMRSESHERSVKEDSYCDDDHKTRDGKKALFNENPGKAHKYLTSSHLHESNLEDVGTTSKSRSRERHREKSQLHDITHGASRLETHREDAERYISRETKRGVNDERMSQLTTDYRHGSREPLRDRRRERSSSRSRHTLQEDKYHSRETRERNREGSREIWDRDRGRDLKEIEKDRMRKKGWEVEKERKRSKDAERYRDRERGRDKERETDRERERDRDMRERERLERGRDRYRENEIDRISRNYKYNNAIDGRGDRDRINDYKQRRHDEADYKERSRKNDLEKVDKDVRPDVDSERLRREEADEEAYQERALQVGEEEEEVLNRIKESRRRRQAILEKYKTRKLQQQPEPLSEDTVKKNEQEPFIQQKNMEEHSQAVATAKVVSGSLDGRREVSDTDTGDTPFSVGISSPRNGVSAVERTSGPGGLGAGTPKSERSNSDDIFGESSPRALKLRERSNDMFSDDMFGESPAGVRKSGKGDGLTIHRSGLQDNWDDAEGYYSYRFGEILDGRYEVIAAHGKGVFSTVVRAKDLKAGSGDPEEVAIKIIRNNEKMYKAGLEELVILKKLVGRDVEDRRHCVRFLSSFKYRNHLCLVFESLHMNLREVLKKFGRNIGLKLTAVRAYAKQLFIALKHLRNCGVLHTDIKPDNMLVNHAKNVLKLCDFGNAMFAGKNEITPYLVSRFYRAPEIILGLPYDHPVDIWSVGCCLFEFYSGKVLFPGPSNNDMLRLHMELKGPFPKKMLRKGAFTENHFDSDLNFFAIEEDPVSKKAVKRLVNIKPKDFGSIVLSSSGEDPKMLANFKDLLDKIFTLDPDKRITVQQALSHPFITGK